MSHKHTHRYFDLMIIWLDFAVCEKVEAKGRTTYNEVNTCILYRLAMINYFLVPFLILMESYLMLSCFGFLCMTCDRRAKMKMNSILRPYKIRQAYEAQRAS